MNFVVFSSCLLPLLLLEVCTAGNPSWHTLRRHIQSRPNLSEQLKPTPYHYGLSVLDYGGNHPFELTDNGKNNPFEHGRRLDQDQVPLRDSETIDYDGANATDFEMLRLHFVTEPLLSLLGQSSDVDDKINAIMSQVLPAVQKTWMSLLDVVHVQGNIPVQQSDCFGAFNNVLPSSILENGVDNADLVVIVSAIDFLTTDTGEQATFCTKGVLAVATSCVLDQFDRPIVGFINFCLGSIDRQLQEETHDFPHVDRSNLIVESAVERDGVVVISDAVVADTILVATHEVGHVLGVDSNLFHFFRDPTTGEPLTPRPFQEKQVTCVDGKTVSRFFPGENVLRNGTNTVGELYYDIVTPRVTAVARNQFNCQSLNGARLENQQGGGCTGSHFDERLFFSELMGPVFSGTSDILSPLTLALLEDSGWYQVYYENSQVSPFGFGAGCGFVNDRCIIDDAVPNYATGSFCTDVSQVNALTGLVDPSTTSLLCDPSHRSIAVCNLFTISDLTSIATSDVQQGIKYFTDSNIQAATAQVDWCPVPLIPVGIDCTDASGSRMLQSYLGEAYGSTSRCVNFEHDTVSGRSVAGCFDIQCDARNRHVIVDGNICEYDDQLIPTTTVDGSVVNMICPKLAVVCPELYCQGGCSGRGVCNFSTNQCECFDSENTSPICSPKRGTRVPFTLPPTPSPQRFSSASSIASLSGWFLGLATFILI